MSIKRRLEDLEANAKTSREERKATESREVLKRMTYEEIKTYEAALRRAREAGGFVEEDRPILERVEELREEVRNGN